MTTEEIVTDFPELTPEHVRPPSSSLPCANAASPPREASVRPEPVEEPRRRSARRVSREPARDGLNLDTATDREIREYAREHGHVIVSKDSDFRQLAFLHGPPPKVVWLRVGNASTATVLRILLDHTQAVEAFALSEDEALLVLPGMPS